MGCRYDRHTHGLEDALTQPIESVPSMAARSDQPAILIEGVTKRFRDKTAVDGLDLVVPTGSVCGFLGPNGAGKTTTIRMVMSIFAPTAGRISVLGRASAIESKDRIGYLPEERGLYRKMRVMDFLLYIGRLKGKGGPELKSWISEWLEKVELPGVERKRCDELSKGMQQKVQFLATIIHDPDLVILDEPFSGLDPVNRRLLRELVDELHTMGKTIIFSTHVLEQAEQLCERIFLINRGKKLLDGTLEEIRAEHDPKVIEVEPMDSEEPQAIADAIAGLRGVAWSKVVSAASRSSGARIHASAVDAGDPAGLISAIAGAVPVRRVELRRPSLEDIFVSLVDTGDSDDSIRAQLREDGSQEVA